jgi:hypothetical protein
VGILFFIGSPGLKVSEQVSSWEHLTMVVSVGASPTGPTSNGQSDVENLEAGRMGVELSAPRKPG